MLTIGNNEPLPFNLPDKLKAELRKNRLAAGYDDNGNKIIQPKVFTDSELSELIKNAEDASRLNEASHRATDALDRLLRLNKEFTIKFIKEYLGYLIPIKYDNKETNIIDQYFKDMMDMQIMVCDIKNDCYVKLDNVTRLVNKRVLELKDRK